MSKITDKNSNKTFWDMGQYVHTVIVDDFHKSID